MTFAFSKMTLPHVRCCCGFQSVLCVQRTELRFQYLTLKRLKPQVYYWKIHCKWQWEGCGVGWGRDVITWNDWVKVWKILFWYMLTTKEYKPLRSWDSSVSTMSRPRAGRPRNRGSISDRVISSPKRSDSMANTAFYPEGTGVSLPEGESAGAWGWSLSPRLKINIAIPPVHECMRCGGTTSLFSH